MFCLFSDAKISTEISVRMYQYRGISLTKDTPFVINVQIFLLPVLTIISIGLAQMTLSFFVKPFYSFAVTITGFVITCYDMNPWVIGNYAMVQRAGVLVREGMEISQGLFLTAALSIGSVLIGLIFFRRYDILDRE